MNITADLRQVKIVGAGNGRRVAIGYVDGDTKGRFVDGAQIRTSLVQKIEDDLIHTLNSVYRVTDWAEKPESLN